MSPSGIEMHPAPHRRRGGSSWLTGARAAGFALTFAASVLSFPVFTFAFWVALDTLARLAGVGRGGGLLPFFFFTQRGWPSDVAFALGTVASWCVLYLGYDHVNLWGNRLAQRRADTQAPPPGSIARFYVELRRDSKDGSLPDSDTGWLTLYPDRFHFAGEQWTLTVPRGQIIGAASIGVSAGRLTGAWVILRLPAAWGRLRLVNRTGAVRLSDTAALARTLARALNPLP